MGATSRPLFWIYNENANPQQQSLVDDDDNLFSKAFEEIQAPAIISTISLVSTYLFESIFFQTCFVISSAHLATRLIKKMVGSYTLIKMLEEEALTITRRKPYVYILTALIAFLFAWHLPILSLGASLFLGILSGLAITLYSHSMARDEQKKDGNR